MLVNIILLIVVKVFRERSPEINEDIMVCVSEKNITTPKLLPNKVEHL